MLITPDEATLGATIDVPTPDGNVNVKLPAGVRSGQSLRLRGKGWPLAKINGLRNLSLNLSPTRRETLIFPLPL